MEVKNDAASASAAIANRSPILMSYSLFDTHTHFDVPDFDTRSGTAGACSQSGRGGATDSDWFVQSRFQDLLYTQHFLNQLKGAPQSYLAPGLHPVYIEQHQTAHLADLESLLKTEDCVAVGEIGLDTFLAQHKQPDMFQKQRDFCCTTGIGTAV